MQRPQPPADIFEISGASFVPSSDLEGWARQTFIEPDAELANEEHFHLNQARIGFVWTTTANARAGNRIVGQCELMPPMAMGRWQKARAEQQIEEWFGYVPDFLITLDASYAVQCDDIAFMSLVEHELYHAGQEQGPFGPKFRKSGLPAFAIRGHDLQEFVSIARRYGVDACAGAAREFVEAANRPPEIAPTRVAQACGTCQLMRAA